MKKKEFSGLLTLDQLKKLRPSLNETDRKSIFRRALDFYSMKFNAATKRHDPDPYIVAYNAMKTEFLPKNTPPIKYIGGGSGRFAFASDNGRVCKFTYTESGFYENSHEIKIFSQYDYSCFVKMYDCDKDTNLGLEVEACAEIDDEDEVGRRLAEMHAFGDSTEDMLNNCVSMCYQLSRNNFDIDSIDPDSFAGSLYYDYNVKKLARIIKFPGNNPQAKVFNQLVRFYIDQHTYLDDLHIGNFGYAYRYGKIVLIILDAGV